MVSCRTNRQLIPAIDLGPAGLTGCQRVNSFCCAQGDQVILVEKGRAGTDNANSCYNRLQRF